MIDVGLLIAGTLGCSLLLTGLVRQYALTRQIIDIPNERSSHTFSTPRGGGASIVISFSIALCILLFLDKLDLKLFVPFVVGGLLVGLIGFVDDHRHIPAGWRIIVHFIAALCAIFWLTYFHSIEHIEHVILIDLLLKTAFVLIIVWLLNLYNFMDGIDGIASIEAITTAGAAAFIIYFTSSSLSDAQEYIFVLILLLVSVSGFLVWNWPPAKIFMGDVGSGFLGYIFALFTIYTTVENIMTIWSWFILLGVFIVDATYTLLKRYLKGETWYKAHCSHAYQHAAQKWNSHLKVTMTVMGINLIWLFPLAWIAAVEPKWGIQLTIAAYLPLVLLATKLKAGEV